MDFCRQPHLGSNQKEYGEFYPTLRFIDSAQAARATRERAELLASLASAVQLGCHDTKLDCRRLSPGCQACTQGTWSCLFINGICNARCFYCPTEQSSRSEPTTNGIMFPRPQDYLDYVQAFGFTGVSISGGEPLMTFDRSLTFIGRLKKKFGRGLHLWLYTNGILVTAENLAQLCDAGLDEIRLDITSTDYSLEKVRLAIGRIPVVTVEIPALPEDYLRLQTVITELDAVGLDFLNLHQLRCTPFNRPNLVQRDYTFLPGPKVTVLESELAVLRLIRYALEKGLRLPINYCSYVYKHRYQGSAARRRLAGHILKPYEDVTEAGYIRSLCARGAGDAIGRRVAALTYSGCDARLWHATASRDALYFSAALWDAIPLADMALSVSYFNPILLPAVSYRHAFTELALNNRKKVVIERMPALPEQVLQPHEQDAFKKSYLERQAAWGGRGNANNQAGTLSDLDCFERTQEGLQEYY